MICVPRTLNAAHEAKRDLVRARATAMKVLSKVAAVEVFADRLLLRLKAKAGATLTLSADLAPIIAELQAAGARSLRAIAAGLNERGISTPRGTGLWQANTVAQLLARLPA
jgi:hypothetical protein